MTLRAAAKTLLVLTLTLPVAQMVLVWARGLLNSMGDPDGSAMLGHVGTACLVLWALGLVGLVIVVAFLVLQERPSKDE